MKSERIEFIRFDDLTTGILMGGKPYISTRGNAASSKQVYTPYNQIDLLDRIADTLRYTNLEPISNDMKQKEIESLSDKIKSILPDLEDFPEETNHLELYLNPSELSLIPFELLLNQSKKPYFLKENDLQFYITRNFRSDRKKRSKRIPNKPRVLFVHSKPDHKSYLNQYFSDLPHTHHSKHIQRALKYWGDDESTYKELSNATFEQFKAEIRNAINNGNPYTHIHILIHGSLIFDYKQPSNFEYGIAFYSEKPKEEKYKATPAQDIKDFFYSIENKDNLPYMVNYMICDGANFVNGMKADKNPVQVTFEAGVPVVLGSQFPLSMDGSTYITSELYKQLFEGKDIRTILMNLKETLYNNPNKYGHDWVSLVSYIDFPDDYELQLIKLKNELQLTILNALRNRNASDELSEDDFIRSKIEVQKAINSLKDNIYKAKNNPGILPEQYILESNGLIASAYKRLAESEFVEGKLYELDTWANQLELLKESKDWYLETSKMNLSHYWSASQYVSLCIVLEGSTEENLMYWNICRTAAFNEIENDPKTYWAYGTLIELNLLRETSVGDVMIKKEIDGYIEKLIENIRLSNQPMGITSTELQLGRYLDWWNHPQFKIPKSFLAHDKEFLASIIEQLKAHE